LQQKFHVSGKIFLTAFLFLISVQAVSFSQDFALQADNYLQELARKGEFMGAVLVAKGADILISNGYGYANLELEVKNTPETIFRIGSMTKQFTSMLIMILVEEGKLNTDDKLIKFIPDYPDGDKITIHHLLTHTSGIPNFTSLPEYKKHKMNSNAPEETIAWFKNKPLDFEPGTQYKYSNSGYVLLGYIITKVSGMNYEKFLTKKIFKPLGMTSSGYDNHSRIIKNRASGYDASTGDIKNADYVDMSIPYSAGAIYSTVQDMYKWDRALYTEKLVKNETRQKIFTPLLNNYAYGWAIREHLNRKLIRHNGSIDGFNGQISRYVDDDFVIIVLGNVIGTQMPANDITEDLAKMYFGESDSK